MNTLRGSYTRRSPDNNFWNVDIPLNHLRKQHQLVKRPISPGQHFPIKLAGLSVPMSAPGGLESTGNQKCPSLLFHSRGKKNSRADQSAGMRRGMLPAQGPQWTPSLTAMSPREKTSHCPVTELTVQRRRRRKHPSSTVATASSDPPQHWLGLAQHRPANSNNSPTHVRPEIVHHSKPSSSSQRYACRHLVLKEKPLQVRCVYLCKSPVLKAF